MNTTLHALFPKLFTVEALRCEGGSRISDKSLYVRFFVEYWASSKSLYQDYYLFPRIFIISEIMLQLNFNHT